MKKKLFEQKRVNKIWNDNNLQGSESTDTITQSKNLTKQFNQRN